ncbi:NACHT, LRR and PYD domains-containing protein 3-like isoform X2 [Hyperolius riggenbachi]
MVRQMILDESGHALKQNEIQDIQEKHKEYLLETTEVLVECKPPGTSLANQRFLISERFVNLVVVSMKYFRHRTQHELIEIGEKHEEYLYTTQKGLERISPKRLFHWNHQIKGVPNMIMISGVPGVGKTTLMQKFVHDWVNGKLYQRFSFVFFFKFRELNQLEKISLEEMILHRYPYLRTQLENILKEPDKLLFIFDGLDESSHRMDFTSSPLCTDPKQQEQLGVLLVNLLRQILLQGCSVLITSRPAKLASIDSSIFQIVCDIMGFFTTERKAYFDQFFEDKELAKKAFKHVKENDTLYTFCYIPSYCWIICTVLSVCFKQQQGNYTSSEYLLPKTVTQLFVTFINNILSNHSQHSGGTRELLLPLGWLAEYGVMNQNIVFDEKHFETFSVDKCSHLFTSFLMASNQCSYNNYAFLHLTVQEFMAALVHHVDYNPEKLNKALEKAKSFQDGRAEMFLRFLSGLSDGSTRALLKPSLSLSIDGSTKVIAWLQQMSPLVRKTCKDFWERRETLNIFAYFFESRNKELVLDILGQNLTLDFSKFSLTPLDCTVLAFILISCKVTERLDLEKSYLDTECWEKLSQGLHTVQILRLSANELKDNDIPCIAAALAHPDCKIQDLSLGSNLLTHTSCLHLAREMSSNQTLKKLDLSRNNLSGPHFRDLMKALSSPTCRVQHLMLYHTKLTHEDSQFLELLSSNTSLSHLSVSFNNITDSGSGHIINLIENSSSLIEVRTAANGFSEDVKRRLKNLQNKANITVRVL